MSVGGKAVSGKQAAALALHRFGFGPVGDQINAIAADPRGALQADLDRPAAGELKVDLPSSAEAARAVFDFQASGVPSKYSPSALRKRPTRTNRARTWPMPATPLRRRSSQISRRCRSSLS